MKLKYCGSRSFLYVNTARGHSLTATNVTREGHKWYCSESQEIASCCYPEGAHCHSRCTQSHNTDLSLLV